MAAETRQRGIRAWWRGRKRCPSHLEIPLVNDFTGKIIPGATTAVQCERRDDGHDDHYLLAATYTPLTKTAKWTTAQELPR